MVTQIKKNYKLDPGRAGPGGEGMVVGGLLGVWATPGGRRSPWQPSPAGKGSAGRWLANTVARCPPMGAVPSVM